MKSRGRYLRSGRPYAPAFVARPARALAAGGRAGVRAGGGLARDIYSALPLHGSGRGSAASRSVARQALPCQRSAIPVAATSALYRATMHGAA